ncbi:uncharacterized protein F4822DRAFT_428926 [Hypoxylon trugodes]|uniref:uncharacterized protein n=1 Tax=Hypoxylon trugodes TaxID=326681 RepID=UPI002191555A|nr:uncharacterized protein F4822DRAFT_428926 [Hypoxylon trugodes]KAI1388306.1 hypothetical protein F4822DRAFT_428926 [Hypoxylon trugodes]
MDAAPHYHGSLVAFEGPQDIISTQLRLLPNSPNILIIPPLQFFIKEDEPEAQFDARSHILTIHKACCERIETAWAFLRESTPSNKRLVFMNGGTASSQVECISDIAKYVTNGDLEKAERIFNRLVRDGVTGLRGQQQKDLSSKPPQPMANGYQPSQPDGEAANDPSSEAMRAADALDDETASLQSNHEVDLTSRLRPRSTSVPAYRIADDLQNAAPFYVFGAHRWHKRNNTYDSAIPQQPRRSHTTQDSRKATRRALEPVGSRVNEINGHLSPLPNAAEEDLKKPLSPASFDFLSPHSFASATVPNTPAICEAYVVNVRHSTSAIYHKKTKPVDQIYSSAIRNQDILLCSFPHPPDSKPLGPEASPRIQQERPLLRSKFASEIPRPTFSTPRRSIIRRNPPSPLNLHKPLRRPVTYIDRATSPRNSYVDRGTTTEPEPELNLDHIYTDQSDTDAELTVSEDAPQPSSREQLETVMPMLENLVILFKAEKPDLRLEATIQAFRDGKYPISKSPPETEAEKIPEQSRSPSPQKPPQRVMPLVNKPKNQVQHAEVAPAYRVDADEYDPFAYGKYPRPPNQNASSNRPSTPPTRDKTPPSATKKLERCFHDFTTTDCRTAVCMQNSLRSILNIYFPPEDTGFHQFNFPLLPELSSLWKPVFREAETGTVIKRKRKVDLILAIGAQQGVDKDFLSAISGSLEKLGTKPNGVTRSGRLDLRFLIASAMQAFTSQPLTSQTQDNPFSNPLLLATLIIPHLETYMAAHAATRFLLLEYPPEHLTTVLALQRLVGADLLRIVGILYSEDSGAKACPSVNIPVRRNTHVRMNTSQSGISATSTRTGATLYAPAPAAGGAKQTTFSKANYLLTSSANESDIAELISRVWKILIDVSTFYIPDGVAQKSVLQVRKEEKRNSQDAQGRPLAQTPLLNTTQQYAPLASAAAMMGFGQKYGGYTKTETEYTDTHTNTSTPPPPPPPPKHKHRKGGSKGGESIKQEMVLKSSKGSVTETIKSSKTARTMRSQRNKLRNMLGREIDGDGVNINGGYVYEWWDDEDDGLAAEERKYIPLYGKQNWPRKGNSSKALKWLGLAT